MCQADRLALSGVALRDTIWYAEAHPAACRVRFWVLEKVYKNPDGTFIGFMAFEVLTNER